MVWFSFFDGSNDAGNKLLAGGVVQWLASFVAWMKLSYVRAG